MQEAALSTTSGTDNAPSRKEQGLSEDVVSAFAHETRRLCLAFLSIHSEAGSYTGPPAVKAYVEAAVEARLEGLGRNSLAPTLFLNGVKAEAVALEAAVGLQLESAPPFADNGLEMDSNVLRLEWMRATLKCLLGLVDLVLSPRKRRGFKNEAWCFRDVAHWDTYLEPQRTSPHETLDRLLPPSANEHADNDLEERFDAYWAPFMVPKSQYVETIVESVRALELHLQRHPLLADAASGWQLDLEFVDNPGLAVEAQCRHLGGKHCVLEFNTSKPLHAVKVLLLVCHEFTHHVQYCVECDAFQQYPELQVELAQSPQEFLKEAGAEVAVSALLQSAPCVSQLPRILARIGHVDTKNPCFSEQLEVLECSWHVIWPTLIAVARDVCDGTICVDEARRKLQQAGFKKSECWPHLQHLWSSRTHILGYGYGADLLLDFLTSRRSEMPLWEAYIGFVRQPLPPSVLEKLKRSLA